MNICNLSILIHWIRTLSDVLNKKSTDLTKKLTLLMLWISTRYSKPCPSYLKLVFRYKNQLHKGNLRYLLHCFAWFCLWMGGTRTAAFKGTKSCRIGRTFLVAYTQLYKGFVHWSIGPSKSMSRKVGKRAYMCLSWKGGWVGHWVWMGVGCPCPPVRNNIVTPWHLFISEEG